MGYMLERAILNELRKRSIDKEVATVLTQVVVDREDKAFLNPTKPIGPFYNSFRAAQLKKENKWQMVEDAGRGFRRVVPSPLPIDIIPKRAIRSLVERGIVVIAAGGGGIPVFINSSGLVEGVEAVIDKDHASALIAREAKADLFIILTGVDRVWENFGKENARPIRAHGRGQGPAHAGRGAVPARLHGAQDHCRHRLHQRRRPRGADHLGRQS